MTHQLEADGIQLEFDNRRILSDIYIKAETGKITGLLGRNGQGKSCLLQIMYGTLACEKSVRIDRISYPTAFQRPDLFQYLPQFHFIPEALTLKKIFRDYALDYAAFSNLFPEFGTKYAATTHDLSGGEQRLVELYIIIKSPSLFALLDEPFTHLHPVQIEKIKELLLAEKVNKGFLITDHLFRHITDISDPIYVLANGKTHLTKSLNDIERLGYARL